MIYLILLPLFAFGVALIIAGFFERQADATEVANMSRRLSHVATRGTGFARIGDPDSRLDDIEIAKEEEARAREARKTTYLPTLSRFAEGDTFLGRMDDELMQVRSPWRATEVVALSVLLGMFVLVLLLQLGLRIYWALPLAAFALLIPRLYIKTLRAAYFRKFDNQLADALMLMSNSLRAGFSFMQALEMIAREAPVPISEEFARATQEIQVGVPIPEALQGMADRVNSMDLRLVVTAVIIQREIGGALAQLLEIIAAVIRERQAIRGEIRTLTAQGRLTGAVLGMMPITVGVLIFFVSKAVAPNDPTFIEPLIGETFGQMMLAGALIWQAIGFWLIMRIVNIKV